MQTLAVHIAPVEGVAINVSGHYAEDIVRRVPEHLRPLASAALRDAHEQRCSYPTAPAECHPGRWEDETGEAVAYDRG